jgi:hypothetical protein
MADDELLRSLGKVAADREATERRSPWERLTNGQATAEEIAELERLASEDPAAATRLAAHRPLDELRRERIVAELTSRLTRRRRRAVLLATAGGLAVAAGAILAVGRIGGPEAIPDYGVEGTAISTVRGATDAGSRSTSTCVLDASETGSFELVARPETAAPGTIAARAFLVRGGTTSPWPGALEVANGSVHILDSAKLLVGASELRVVVGRPSAVDGEAALAKARAGAASGTGWQRLTCAVRAVP